MVSKHRRALERLWKDRCTVYHRVKQQDPKTRLTGFEEKPLFQDLPCKLSFEALKPTNGAPVAAVAQAVKLFLAPDVEIPAGCKIVVTRFNDPERQLAFAKSGEAGVFTDHQEIMLEPFGRYA